MLKWLVTLAVALAVLSLVAPRLRRYGLGRLPGDLHLRKGGRDFYFPLTSTIVLSVLAYLIGRLF